MRAVLPMVLWLVLAMGLIHRAAAQSDGDSVRGAARDQLAALLKSYEPARAIRWHTSNDPYEMTGYLDKPLKYASRFEVYMIVTRQNTIWIRVYPQWYGQHVNLLQVRDANGLMKQLLRFSYHNFFFWGADDNQDIFAGYQFTLESGFPEEAMKVVIRSIPLIDDSVGEMASYIE